MQRTVAIEEEKTTLGCFVVPHSARSVIMSTPAASSVHYSANAPCVGVAPNSYRVGELCLEGWKGAEAPWKDEIKKAPELAQIILDGGSAQYQTVYRFDLLAEKGHLRKM